MATITSEYTRAVRLHRAGNLKGARALYQRILNRDPEHGDALHRLGELIARSERPEEGIRLITKAIHAAGPKHEYCASLGRLFLERYAPREAAACFRQAIALNPFDPEVYLGLSRALAQINDLQQAALAAEQAVVLNRGSAEAWSQFGILLSRLRAFEKAEICFRRAAQLSPASSEVLYNLGIIMEAQSRSEEAADLFARAIRLRPDYAFAHNNLGNILYKRGLPGEAANHYRAALTADPSFARAHLNLGIALLSMGDYERGLPEYEWRFRQPGVAPRHAWLERWNGESLPGGAVLLHSDQGLGDVLQFLRYAPMVKERVATVEVECPASLVRIVKSAAGVDRVSHQAQPERSARQAPLASLPLIFGSRVSSIPPLAPYISIDEDRIEKWRVLTRRFRVGLAWAGNPHHPNDRNRSIPIELFERLTRIPGVATFSLQKPPDLRLPATVHLGSSFGDLADTGAVVSQLDLVISADTVIAHLAGALGRPVWNLLPYAPDWRWMWERDDSPWYPSMRLFRQPKPGDWDAVIAQVAAELGGMAGGSQPE